MPAWVNTSRIALMSAFLHHPHNSSTCSRTDIKSIREVLTHAGVTLSAYESGNL